MIEYSPEEVTFFGFKGRVSETGQLSGLSLIGYVTSCVNGFKEELGDDFIWFTPDPEEEEKVPEGDGSVDNEGQVTSDGEVTEVDEDDSGMSAAGVVFLVIFLLALVGGLGYGAYLYRKDR